MMETSRTGCATPSDSVIRAVISTTAKTFLGLAVAKNSLDGGTDYAFGGATTKGGTQDRTVINNPFPFSGGDFTITIDNMGKQINDYLASHATDAKALYILWGGGNDLFDDDSAQSVIDTANRVGALIVRLANAGARNFLVPNVPPLGAVPNSFGDPTRVAALDLASANYRNQLNSVVASTKSGLAATGITVHVYTFDVWLGVIRVLGQPRRYGFVDTIDSAQGRSGSIQTNIFSGMIFTLPRVATTIWPMKRIDC